MNDSWKTYAKAIAGALTAALTTAGTALTTDNLIEPQEWIGITVAFIGALGVIWAVPNQASDAGSFITKDE